MAWGRQGTETRHGALRQGTVHNPALSAQSELLSPSRQPACRHGSFWECRSRIDLCISFNRDTFVMWRWNTTHQTKGLVFFLINANFVSFFGDLVFSSVMVEVSESRRLACSGNNRGCKRVDVCFTEEQFDQMPCCEIKTECQAFPPFLVLWIFNIKCNDSLVLIDLFFQ